ncbi:hypothetical protein [Kribbella rubisoli]|uniref:hypothetical protein n=1 Tax=Kribbella rubisoli TaxID=3075929 RepID=UPI00102BA0E0|nr:hypothetical protein [Kribbella rubisoli]
MLYDVWGEDLPSNPRAAMQAAISRLRRALSRAELRNDRRTARHAADLLRDVGSNMYVARIAHLAE